MREQEMAEDDHSRLEAMIVKLSFEQIKKITIGAVKINEQDGRITFDRFTEAQKAVYQVREPQKYYHRCFTSAGMRFVFRTDSKTLSLKINVLMGSARKYFSFDVFADGKNIGYLDNFSDSQVPECYPSAEFKHLLGEFSKSFCMGDGVKHVCVYLPWSVNWELLEMTLDDGAFIEPDVPKKVMLAFGDSITQGFDALRPSARYGSQIADLLNLQEVNKAIGGDTFRPELAEIPDAFVPALIIVAYGTNDWSKSDRKTFTEDCPAFFRALRKNYPQTRIYAITPIWRKDSLRETEVGKFEAVEEDIRKLIEGIDNITLISGKDLVPHDECYYADRRLHPNDEGFKHYAKNLYAKIIENP